jgi:hypothetical protein
VSQFLTTWCDTHAGTIGLTLEVLFRLYKLWYAWENLSPRYRLGRTKFKNRLRDQHGLSTDYRPSGGARHVRGVELSEAGKDAAEQAKSMLPSYTVVEAGFEKVDDPY